MPSKVLEPRHGSSIRTGVIMSMIAVFVSLVVSLLYPPFALSIVGETKDGIYQYAASIVLFMSLLSFGIENSYIRFATRAEKEGGDALRKVNFLYLVVFALIGIAQVVGTLIVYSVFKSGAVSTGYDPEEHELMCNYLLLLGLSQGLGFFLSLFSWHLFFKTHFVVYQGAHILTKILSASIGAIALAIGGDAIYVAIAAFAANIFSGLLCLVASLHHHEMRFERMAFSEAKPYLKEILSFSVFVFLSMVVSELNAGFGRWAVGAFGAVEDVTLIAYGIEFYVYESLFALSVSRVFIPSLNEAVAAGDEEKAKELHRKCTLAVSFLLMLIVGGFVSSGREFVYAWLGHTPLNEWAKDTVYCLGVGYLILFALPLAGNASLEIARARKEHAIIGILDLAIALLGALVSALLVVYLPDETKVYGPLFGLGGSSFVSFGIVNNLIYRFKMKLPIGRSLLSFLVLLLFAAAGVAVSRGLMSLIPVESIGHLPSFILAALFYAVPYLLFSTVAYWKDISSLWPKRGQERV